MCVVCTVLLKSLGRTRSRSSPLQTKFLAEYGPEVTDTVFDWTLLVYLGNRSKKSDRSHSKDRYPEGCQIVVRIAQLAQYDKHNYYPHAIICV